jgi:dynein heavy chain, axonemal
METYTEYSKYKLYIEEIEKFEKWLSEAEVEMIDISDQEKKLFGFQSNYDIFHRVQEFIKPFSELWKALGYFVDSKKNWMNKEVFKIDAGEVDSIIKQNSRITSRLLGSFSYNSLSYRIVTDFQEDINKLKKDLPSIELISNPGLRDRHWDEILKIMNITYNYKEGTLKEILFKGIEHFLPQ